MGTWPELRVNVGRLRRRDNLTELRKRSNTESDTLIVDVSVPAKDLEITTARIPDGDPIEVHAEVTASLSGIDVALGVQSSWVGECRRCLEPVSEPIAVDTQVAFLTEADMGKDSDEVEAYLLDGDWIDLGEVVREELMLALPLSPLCEENCEGADPERFPTQGEDEQDEGDEGDAPIDPRWAALSALTFDED